MSKSAQRGTLPCDKHMYFLNMNQREAFREAFTGEEFTKYSNIFSREATCFYTYLFFGNALPKYLQTHFLKFKTDRALLMEMYKLVFAKMYNVINAYPRTYTYKMKVEKFKEEIKGINKYSHIFTDEIYPGKPATSIMPNRARLNNRESHSDSNNLTYYGLLLAAKLIKFDEGTSEGFIYDNEYVKAFTNLTGEIRIPLMKAATLQRIKNGLQGGKRTRKRKNKRSNRKYSRRR